MQIEFWPTLTTHQPVVDRFFLLTLICIKNTNFILEIIWNQNVLIEVSFVNKVAHMVYGSDKILHTGKKINYH